MMIQLMTLAAVAALFASFLLLMLGLMRGHLPLYQETGNQEEPDSEPDIEGCEAFEESGESEEMTEDQPESNSAEEAGEDQSESNSERVDACEPVIHADTDTVDTAETGVSTPVLSQGELRRRAEALGCAVLAAPGVSQEQEEKASVLAAPDMPQEADDQTDRFFGSEPESHSCDDDPYSWHTGMTPLPEPVEADRPMPPGFTA